MSRYKAQEIPEPSSETIEPFRHHVGYNRGLNLVTGVIETQIHNATFIVRTNGLVEKWFSCQSCEAAAEVMAKYHNGDYTTIKWFIKK